MDEWLEQFEREVRDEERAKSGYFIKPAVFRMLSRNYPKEEIADIFSIFLDLVEQIAEEKATYDKLAALEKENMFLKAELERWRALKAKISSDSESKSS